MGGKRRYKRAIVASAAIATSVNSPGAPAFVFPPDPGLGCANARNINWFFAGAGWDDDLRRETRVGFAAWNVLSDETSTRYISSREQTVASHNADAYAVRLVGSGDTRVSCATREVFLNQGVPLTAVSRAMAHEMGHLHGLRHGGHEDTLQRTSATGTFAGGASLRLGFFADAAAGTRQRAQTSLMAGCGAAGGFRPTPDDWAQLYTRELRILNADSGFEANAELDGGWRQTSGTVAFDSTVAARGARSMRIENGSATYRVRVTDALEAYRLRLRYKGTGASTSTYKMFARSVTYGTGNPCGSSGLDFPIVGAWCLAGSFSFPGARTAWSEVSAVPGTVACPEPHLLLGTIDLQFTVSTPNVMWIDDARLELR